MRKIWTCRLNNVFSSNFPDGQLYQQTPEKGEGTQQLKHWHNRNENIKLNVNHKVLSKKFWQKHVTTKNED